MRRYNITSRTLLILAVITFAFASPVLVQEKRQARVDVVPVLEDVKTVLWKRIEEKELDRLLESLWHYGGVWADRDPAVVHPPQELARPLADSDRTSTSGSAKLDEQPGNPPPGNPPSGTPPPGNPPPENPPPENPPPGTPPPGNPPPGNPPPGNPPPGNPPPGNPPLGNPPLGNPPLGNPPLGNPPPGNPPPGNPPPGNPPPTKPWWSWTRWRRAIHGGI